MERNGSSVAIDLLLGMVKKDFSADGIEKILYSIHLKKSSKTAFMTKRKELLDLLESGATEQEMLEAVNLSTKDV